MTPFFQRAGGQQEISEFVKNNDSDGIGVISYLDYYVFGFYQK